MKYLSKFPSVWRTILNGRLNVTVGDFLEQLDKKFDPEVNWIFRTRNFQAFELGLDYMNDSQEYLREQIKGNLCPKLEKFFNESLLKKF